MPEKRKQGIVTLRFTQMENIFVFTGRGYRDDQQPTTWALENFLPPVAETR